ncbi:MAG: ABC transporter ATP-binding protein, partial [Coriobacteriales bacterium]|nr:ABC transporter ATP-binding protein [Coriobacteriales bacterium]
ISFYVNEGEIFGFLGPNGAGKSTTLNVLVGLTTWDRGNIRVAGLDLAHDVRAIKRLIGMVPQDIALYNNLSARENTEYFASLYGLRGHTLKDAAAEALEFVGLKDQMKTRVSKMSGGMKRRLNIACGIAHSPKLIVMDEPTVGVDAQSREHIMDSIRILRDRGATIIYTSHYMPEVQEICDRIAIVDHGHMIACGSESELLSMVTDTKRIAVTLDAAAMSHTGTEDIIGRLQVLPDIKRVTMGDDGTNQLFIDVSMSFDDYTPLLGEFIQHGVPIKQFSTEAPDLETTFLALTGRELRG